MELENYNIKQTNINSMDQLKAEAERCLLCKKASCSAHCPITTPIPEIVTLFKEGKLMEAGEILFENNPLTACCAHVCPHETQCKGNCIRGKKGEPVSFCEIEAYISRYYLENIHFENLPKTKGSVAIIGGGPAGITMAFILAKKGYDITIFDANEQIGGILRYGIPEFRLPHEILDLYHDRLRELGVLIRPNTLVGPVITLDKMEADGYDAIFIGTGLWNAKPLNIKGETLGNVHYAIDYLKSPEVYDLGRRVCVIGAGNVAMDAARTAKRHGTDEVFVLYRRGFENMTCTKAELEETKQEGVAFQLFKAPLELTRTGVRYIETENVTDENGKTSTVNREGPNGGFVEGFAPCDSVLVAVSQNPKNNIVSTASDVFTNKWGLILTDDRGNTTREGVFASGDVVTGAKTVIAATVNAKITAEEIEKHIAQKR